MVLVKKERESNFELLRLIAMIFIVLYHFCSSVKAGIDTETDGFCWDIPYFT